MNKVAFVILVFLTFAGASGGDTAAGGVDVEIRALRMAIVDLMSSYPDEYERGREFIARVEGVSKMPSGSERDNTLGQLRREALLSNPLLDFRDLLLVRRKSEGDRWLPANWQGNERLNRSGCENDIVILSMGRLDGELRTVFRPEGGRFVGDLDLHFDGRRLLFSMPGENRRWQVYEMKVNAAGDGAMVEPDIRELPLIPDSDVDNYDACYLPDGNILFTSTATYTGVPCVQGNSHVANIYGLEVATGRVRRLTFDQDHNWNPTVLNNGRVMYLRWEYSDLPHFVARILFHMNPDGTNQSEYYGSGSYWPNSFFYPRAIPDHPTKVIGVVSGHHGSKRAGELVILDPALGRREADGVVQRIPGYGKVVEPLVIDNLVDQSWPKFLHPYPLSSKYFLVSAKLDDQSAWGVYLVDIFDNMVSLKAEAGVDLLEPTPLKARPVPPVIPSRVDLEDKFATVYLEDIYEGEGLKGVPRGTIKKLRLVTYHFAYRGMGGQQDPIGLDGPWDVKCVLGLVPVERDGSAFFRVPANVPISFQPLDEEGKAVQLMRSWSTAMPGENVSCVGCHESQNAGPAVRATTASRKAPAEIVPWYGVVRGFSFKREVEPVVDEYCAGCHDGQTIESGGEDAAPAIEDAYMFLRRMVRTPTMEPDMRVCDPYEFHADTTELVRMLQTGHYGVKLDAEAWDRIITWIDLNTPFHGTWTENVGRARMGDSVERRRDLMMRYAGIGGIDEEPDSLSPEKPPEQQAEQLNVNETLGGRKPDDVKIVKIASRLSVPKTRVIELGEGMRLDLVRIEAGAFVKGRAGIEIAKPFWMARYETSNKLYAMFDAEHDSRLEPHDFLHFDSVRRGYPLNGADQPVVKVSWNRAVEFCRWLSAKTGLDVRLPTEDQWEWACRAGSTDSFWYADGHAGFAQYDNLADAQMKTNKRYQGKRWEWRPAIVDQDDGYRVSSPVGSFKPNPWGLHDMHGNVAEWTASIYRPASSGAGAKRVVRGGSWSDRPKWAGAEIRWGYREHQKVYNVGFRVVVHELASEN